MEFLCSRSIHRWKYSSEGYIIPNEVTKDHISLKTRVCKSCGKKQVYTMIYAIQNLKKYWKDWDRNDGDIISWKDLE